MGTWAAGSLVPRQAIPTFSMMQVGMACLGMRLGGWRSTVMLKEVVVDFQNIVPQAFSAAPCGARGRPGDEAILV